MDCVLIVEKLTRTKRFIILTSIFFCIWVLYSANVSLYDTKISVEVKPSEDASLLEQINRFDHTASNQSCHMRLTSARINQLFNILKKKEDYFEYQLDLLEVLSFSKMSKKEKDELNISKYFYTDSSNNLFANAKFMEMLYQKSIHYSFVNKSRKFPLTELKKKITLVTAANQRYFGFLKDFLNRITNSKINSRIFFYDLGLNNASLQELRNNFSHINITIKNFETMKIDLNLGEHFDDPKKYAWKPVIIQDMFRNIDYEETFFYVDTAVIFQTNLLQGISDYAKESTMVLPITYHNFSCYTNQKTFNYFRNEVKDFIHMGAHIHAAFISVTKNLISSLIMKAWVTCALDSNCICPRGSRLAPCCGCHRYDQSALQIILSHFFLIPKNRDCYPVYGIDLSNEIITFVWGRPS